MVLGGVTAIIALAKLLRQKKHQGDLLLVLVACYTEDNNVAVGVLLAIPHEAQDDSIEAAALNA